ncbi:MAG: hypothetical protein ACD_17C00382G0001 [uncultured bacterium]|nr:MAG: hypothetical protein ACD_17C00382G0001 [uncultured bacterium]
MGKLANGMVNSSSKAGPLPSELLQEGFYRYILLEALATLGTLPPFTGLTLCTLEEPKEIEEGFYVDIEISIDQKKCWGRLLLPMDFRSLWIRHFADSSIEYVSKEVAKSTFLSLGIKTGSLSVKKSEWEPLHLGDFVPLDKNSYDAHKGTGICMLMLRDIPLFHAKIKNNRVELIDYAFYYEDTMEETRPKKSAETPKPLQDEPRKFPSQEMEPVSIKELPLDITVEIGRIRITLDQLMQLTPGNQLELPIHPDQGVNLTVGGNKIGRAELVYLGEQLGIRILEI